MRNQGVQHGLFRCSMVILALAGTLGSAHAAPPGAPAQEAAGSTGLVAVRDPVTGEMRAPTAAELRALRATPAPGTAHAGPQAAQPVVRPDGTRALQLGESGMVYSVATRGADGQLKQQCVTGAEAAERAVTAPAQPAKQHAAEEHHHGHR